MAHNEMSPRRECRDCGSQKSYVATENRRRDGSIIYLDERGGRWAGRRCPDCERSRVQRALRSGAFERHLIVDALSTAGFQVDEASSWPLKVRQGDGPSLRVGLRYVCASDGDLLFDPNYEEQADVYALVFHAVRIVDATSMKELHPRMRPLIPHSSQRD